MKRSPRTHRRHRGVMLANVRARKARSPGIGVAHEGGNRHMDRAAAIMARYTVTLPDGTVLKKPIAERRAARAERRRLPYADIAEQHEREVRPLAYAAAMQSWADSGGAGPLPQLFSKPFHHSSKEIHQ